MMAQTSLCTLLSATALCPSQLLAMQCHSSCWIFAGHIQQPLTAFGTSHEGQADHGLGGGCSPASPAVPQDRAAWEPGTGHLPYPAGLTPGFGLSCGCFTVIFPKITPFFRCKLHSHCALGTEHRQEESCLGEGDKNMIMQDGLAPGLMKYQIPNT